MSGDPEGRARRPSVPIVSSSHLVSDRASELSEFEFGLYICTNAFQRWIVRCIQASGIPDMNALDVMVIHTVNHRAREKRLSDICFVLNIEDTHLVNYAVKKLLKAGLIDRKKQGKEMYYSATDAGREACEKYRAIREDCLITAFGTAGLQGEDVGAAADLLRALSGLYDQAARSATSL